MNGGCSVKRRLWAAMLAMFVLVDLSHGGWAMAAGPEATVLAVVEYGDWASLQRLAPLGLDVFDLQDQALATVLTQTQLDRVRGLGFAVRAIDAPAHPDEYYLAGRVPTGSGIALVGAGQPFEYVPGLLLLRADPGQAERWIAAGFSLKKLLGGVVLPTAPPAGEPARAAALSADPLIQNLVNAVSQTELYNTIRDLQDDPDLEGYDALGSRYSCTPGNIGPKRDYVQNRLAALGLSVRLDHFGISCNSNLDNVEATLPGWGPDPSIIYIACAHYDSISLNSDPYVTAPGADDNGSGTAGVIEAARVLSAHHFKHTLRFVTFPGEEQGIYGSQYYALRAANATPRADIRGVVNLDMIAWDSNHDHRMEIHAGTNSNSQPVGTTFRDAITAYGINLTPTYFTQGSLTFSDHSRFWDKNFPAILAIERYNGDFNTHYHSSSDTLSTLDLGYARSFVQATVATLAGFAELIPPGLGIDYVGRGELITGTVHSLTVKYFNAGPSAATSVRITDTLPSGLTYVSDNSGLSTTHPAPGVVVWQVGNLAAYSPQRSFVVNATVGSTLPAGALLSSTVEISGVTSVDDPVDNRARWTGLVPVEKLYLPLIFRDAP